MTPSTIDKKKQERTINKIYLFTNKVYVDKMDFKYPAGLMRNARDNEASLNIIGQFRQVIEISRGAPADYKQ